MIGDSNQEMTIQFSRMRRGADFLYLVVVVKELRASFPDQLLYLSLYSAAVSDPLKSVERAWAAC